MSEYERINAIELIIDALKESIGPDTDADQAAKINATTEETRSSALRVFG